MREENKIIFSSICYFISSILLASVFINFMIEPFTIINLIGLILSGFSLIISYQLFIVECVKAYLIENNYGEYIKLKQRTKTIKDTMKI